jgi:hypothetical protein
VFEGRGVRARSEQGSTGEAQLSEGARAKMGAKIFGNLREFELPTLASQNPMPEENQPLGS